MPEIEVYHWTRWDQIAGDNVTSKRPASLETIQRRGGKPILETRRVVDSTDLDGNGDLKKGR
jgi:hypothetical protein